MPLHLIPSDVLRSECRQRLESCELWLRRLVHDQLAKNYGESYVQMAQINGQHIFRSEIRKHAADRLATQPSRYRREVDTLLLDHIVSVICKPEVFKKYFAQPLNWAFPDGNESLRTVLDRLVPIRNLLSHGNPLTSHDAERVLCYCDDIIFSLIHFYAGQGMTNDFDAPSFTRFSDSLGHIEYPQATRSYFDYSATCTLRAGDSIRLEVEVDAHYPPSDYQIKWVVANISAGESSEGHSFSLTLLPRHVGETFTVQAALLSTRGWHRHSNFDASLVVVYKVLPPLNDLV